MLYGDYLFIYFYFFLLDLLFIKKIIKLKKKILKKSNQTETGLARFFLVLDLFFPVWV